VRRYESGAVPVTLEYSEKCLLELLVGKRVAERIDRAVEIAHYYNSMILLQLRLRLRLSTTTTTTTREWIISY